MNNNKLIGIISTVVSAALIVLFFVLFLLSFNAEDKGEWGKEFESNSDYLVLLIASIIGLVYGLYLVIKGDNENVKALPLLTYVLLFIGVLLSCYFFGVFFKALAKGNGFQAFKFVFAMVGLVALGCGCLSYFKINKKSN